MGGDHVEKLSTCGHAHLGKIEQEAARKAQPIIDFVGLIEVWIVDKPLPANGGAGLFEVNAHDDAQIRIELRNRLFEQGGIVERCLGIVDGAGTSEHEEAGVLCVQDGGDFSTRVEDGGRGGFCDGTLFLEKDWRENNFGPLDANVFCGAKHR